GVKGSAPSHPELLDWLAGELIRSGWSMKHIHRLIVMSSTYRQASTVSAKNQARDPDNTTWWRFEPRRLEAEGIRESLLAGGGGVDGKAGGPSDKEKSLRRGLYLFQKREAPPQQQALFDGPIGMTESCARRLVTTVPLQSLYLLNSDFSVERA